MPRVYQSVQILLDLSMSRNVTEFHCRSVIWLSPVETFLRFVPIILSDKKGGILPKISSLYKYNEQFNCKDTFFYLF